MKNIFKIQAKENYFICKIWSNLIIKVNVGRVTNYRF